MSRVTRTQGIALAGRELFISGGGDGAARVSLGGVINDRGHWPELADALRALADSAPAGALAVALLPPLVEIGTLHLPPLDDGELVQLLTRTAARYFVGARGPQVVGLTQQPGRNGAPSTVVAAAAPARVIAAIDAAARESGWTVVVVTPAEAGWAAAAVALWPGFARRSAHLLVHEGSRTVLLALQRGRVSDVRRFRPGAADADLIADAILAGGGTSAAVGAVGGATGRQELIRALGVRGITVNLAAGPHAAHADTPEILAAEFAVSSAGPLMMNEQARAERMARGRRMTIVVAAAALLLLIVAAGLNLWGVRRQLAAVRSERAAIKPMVAATLVGRTSVEDAYRRLAAVAEADRLAPRWAPVVAELSAILPDDAFLTGFRTRGDSLVIDGMAARASRVFDALSASTHLTAVRAPAPVRREAPEGGDPLERFSIAATLRHATPATSALRTAGAP